MHDYTTSTFAAGRDGHPFATSGSSPLATVHYDNGLAVFVDFATSTQADIEKMWRGH